MPKTSLTRLRVLAFALAGLGLASPSLAHDRPEEMRGSPVTDTFGHPTRSTVTRDCVRSDFRSPGETTGECNRSAPVARAAPAQAPVADFMPEPEPSDMVPVPPLTTEPAVDDRISEPVWFYEEEAGTRGGDGILSRRENPDYAAEVAAAEAAMLRADEPPAAVVAQAPAPPPVVAAPAKPPAPERVTLDADALFAFNSSVLRRDGTRELDELAAALSGLSFEAISLTGHTDRLGSDALNARLSDQRAQAVKRYLVEKGIDPARIQARGVGSKQPVTAGQCDRIRKREPLIRCLAPDRRVEVQVVALKP